MQKKLCIVSFARQLALIIPIRFHIETVPLREERKSEPIVILYLYCEFRLQPPLIP